MELFANEGLLIPEQVWDGVGADSAHGYTRGEGTDSATPLAWSHAEYVKLLRSVSRPAGLGQLPAGQSAVREVRLSSP
jgi:glucoamylase